MESNKLKIDNSDAKSHFLQSHYMNADKNWVDNSAMPLEKSVYFTDEVKIRIEKSKIKNITINNIIDGGFI